MDIMGYFFFDESKHPDRGFSIGAFVYCSEDPTKAINDALLRHGFRPGAEEFKSSANMRKNPKNKDLRDELGHLLRKFGQIGVVVVPDEREIGMESLKLLSKMLLHEEISAGSHEVYFDEGLFSSAKQGKDLAEVSGGFKNCKLHFEKDSKIIAGIQLADLATHTCAIMLSEELGFIVKIVKAGEGSGYEPDLDIELGFELWAGIRYNFLSAPLELGANWNGNQDDLVTDVKPFGLHVSENASQALKSGALKRFGQMYIGCIH
jgi:hypothetical protein